MGRISKMGDRYFRCLLVNGMTSQFQAARRKPEAHPWVIGLLATKPNKLVAVAMANKAARIAWGASEAMRDAVRKPWEAAVPVARAISMGHYQRDLV